MTAVRVRSPYRRLLSWARALVVQPATRAERLYAALAAGLCLGLLATYGVGQLVEGFDQQRTRALLADGRDPVLGALRQPGSASAADLGHQGAEQAAAPLSLPAWVQTARGTTLWNAPSGGSSVASLPQWQYLKVAGAEADRFHVQSAPPGAVSEGWVDLADVGVSGPPADWVAASSDLTLFAGADSSDRIGTVPAGTNLEVSGEGAADRLFVYWPRDPTSRRTGYGWVARDQVAPAAPPAELALPSPQFHAVARGLPGTYRARLGDSVQSIATRFGLTVDALLRMNGLDSPGKVVVGLVLQVASVDPPSVQAPGPRKVRDLSPGLISAEHAVVVDDESGEILWAKDANTPVPPASLTKIVTALVTLDHANLTDNVVVHVDSRKMTDSTVMGLYPGEQLTVEDLLYGMMLPSGNDAALALAQYVAGTKESFADLMNEKVRSLGLTGSHFVNPHGLDAAGHVASAYDMAMLAREGMRNPAFRSLAAARTYDTPHGKGYSLSNLNQLLWRYPGADGVKIGFTDAAGRAIVGSATRDGHRVIVVALRSADTYADCSALLDWAFGSYSWQEDE
ncbi:MAG TPA: LysM peptidoglycan-binding domain-containing protein [Chloroflexota bacterium]|nr:LysM peptidoglycan-binding domain-containing protein [Chloroflexota bacterium]